MATARDEEKVRRTLGGRIRDARLDEGLSQEELAERSGLHRTYIGSVERGERNISLINIVRIAGSLGIDPGSLVASLRIGPR
jgi:transcriptional regulator with XRE-family HTH domain